MANFPSLLAQNEHGVLAQGLVGQVYDVDDVLLTTPLDIFSKTGAAFPGNQLTSGPNGVLPEFSCPGYTVVRWASGPFRMDIPCVDQVPVGGTVGQILAKASGQNYDLHWIDAPTSGGAGAGAFEVDLRDYLDPNGVTGVSDDLPAFQAALAGQAFGAVNLKVPVGEFWTSSAVELPSHCELGGMGMDFSAIRLLPNASNDTWVVTNSDPVGGNTNIRVHDLTLDWNYSATRPGAGGGTRSSCLTFRHVEFAWIDRVRMVRPGQHGIDISSGSIDYPETGDGGAEPTDPSRYIWIRECRISEWADDGITTHHSEHIWIENNHCSTPRLRGNCNGIEVDDGSRYVKLKGNYTEFCYSGVEVKAHGTSNAPRGVTIEGHTSFSDVRSYNFRHIGHHSGADPVSKSAFDLVASNLVSIYPNNDLGYQDEATPRSLVISAYKNVTVNGLLSIGRGGYAAGVVGVAVQFRAGNVSLCGLNLSGWGGADADVSVTTGNFVSVSGLNVRESSRTALYSGSTVTAAHYSGINATGPTLVPTTYAGIDIYTTANGGVVVAPGCNATGYGKPIRADGADYATMDTYHRKLASAPAGVTRLADLDVTKDYYFTTAQFALLTDVPAGQAGGNFVFHSRVNGDSCVQTVTRNTTSVSLQTSNWRILNWVSKAGGPFNNALAAAAGTTGGSVQYVRKSGTTWGPRPTADAAVMVIWVGADPSPAIVDSGTGGMLNNVDLRMVTP